jgi:hypothetical protein
MVPINSNQWNFIAGMSCAQEQTFTVGYGIDHVYVDIKDSRLPKRIVRWVVFRDGSHKKYVNNEVET